ncbi:MAG: BatA domain-containing protein, partial [Chthoniobacteraceae bacterium]
MNFLFPAMLAGLAGLGIPVALHLIARHKFPVRDFPTLRLLFRDERTNVFAPRLIDPWQLLLRLLVLLLLVLAMSRLFIPGFPSTTAPRNLVVIVDCSASMSMTVKNPVGDSRTTLLELARRKVRELLSEVKPPGQSALIAAGDQTRVLAELQPDSNAVIAAMDSKSGSDGLKAGDGSGQGLLYAIATAGDILHGRREVKSQIVVLTDLRSSAFDVRNQKDMQRLALARADLGKKLDIIFVDVASGATENLGITDARIQGGKVKVGDDAHVLAHVINSGTSEKTAKLQLAIGNQPDPAIREVTIAPGSDAIVDMTTPVNRASQTIAQVRLKEGDALPEDDAFSVPLNVADVRRVLIVNGASQMVAADTALAGLGQPAPANQPQPGETEEVVDGATIFRYV